MRCQMGKAKGLCAAALCWDLRKFYETMSHERLREQAVKLGFPLAIVDVALAAYKMARKITFEGQIAEEAYPGCGIVAGDSLSDVLVKL